MLLRLWLSSTRRPHTLSQARLGSVSLEHNLKALLQSLTTDEQQQEHSSSYSLRNAGAGIMHPGHDSGPSFTALPTLARGHAKRTGKSLLTHSPRFVWLNSMPCHPSPGSSVQGYHTKAGPSAASPGDASKDPDETDKERWQRRSQDASR